MNNKSLNKLQKKSGDVAVTIIFSQTHAWVDDGIEKRHYSTLAEAMNRLMQDFNISEQEGVGREEV